MTELVAPTRADARSIAEVINAHSMWLRGRSEERADSVAQWFAIPELDPAADMRLAIGAGGVPKGYADISTPEDGTPRVMVDLRVAPGHPGALVRLFAWTESRARERLPVGGAIQYFPDERDTELREFLSTAGYVVVRSSFVMERALAGELEPPVWPVGIEPRRFDRTDAEAVWAVQDEAFVDHWGYTRSSFDGWRAHHLVEGDDTSFWCVAWDGPAIAGISLNRPHRGEDETIGWIDVLAVRRPWRRRGLGEALLRDAFDSFAAAGRTRAGLSVDAENTTGAVTLYERVGMHVIARSDTWQRTV